METKAICLLVVNDDLTCRNIVAQILQRCTYEVLHIGSAMDALKAIWEKKDTINLVLTNVHRLDEKGTEILNHIQKNYNFTTILMSPDDKKIESNSNGQESSFAAYVVNFLSINDINSLWELALASEKAQMVQVNHQEGIAQMDSTGNEYANEASRENTPSESDEPRTYQKRKKKEVKEKSEPSEGSGDDQLTEKKPRVVWTREMHQKFLEAIEVLGPEKAFPKKIVEVMNVPGLTRENVASHLQKYRMCLRRTQEDSVSSNCGINLANHVTEPCFPSYLSALNFNCLQGYSHVTQRPYGIPFQQSPCDIIPITARISSSISNLGPSSFAMSQNNNYVPSANSQCTDTTDIVEMQSKFFTRNPMNNSCRIYGDDTKNMLFSIGSGSCSSSGSHSDKSFIGFKLSSDGKSVEFGQQSISGERENRTEMMFSASRTSGAENLDQFQTPSTTSFILPHSEVLDYCPSISIDCTSQQEPFLSLLGSSMEETAIHCTSLPNDCTSKMQDHPLQHLCSPKNDESLQAIFDSPAAWNSAHSPTLPLPDNFLSHEQQTDPLPPLCNPGSDNSVQNPSTAINRNPQLNTNLAPPSGISVDENAVKSSSMFDPEQEISMPILGRSGNDTSVQEASTSTDQTLHKESPIQSLLHELGNFGAEEDFNILLNETGGSSLQLFWEGNFDDRVFNHANN